MVIIEKKYVENIPVLEVVKQNIHQQELPTVFFFHGITSAKENNLHYAYLMAEKNLRVVLPDADFHGERSKEISFIELGVNFWNIVLQTIQELSILKTFYTEHNLTDPANIGVVGTSMGGFITLGALTQYKWIKAAVSLMGCPSYLEFTDYALENSKQMGVKLPVSDSVIQNGKEQLKPFDLNLNPEKLAQRPLLFWHGEKDPVVPYTYAHQFYEKVKGLYNDAPERLQFIGDPQAEHKVTREGVLSTVNWFVKYLT